jgi:hypothetical protein
MASSITPVRQLGALGIVTDLAPEELPPNAWTSGVNVRFVNGRVNRGMVFREWFDVEDDTSPTPVELDDVQAIFSFTDENGIDKLILPREGGEIASYTSGVYADVSYGSLSPVTVTTTWTHTVLAGISYLATGDLPYPLRYDVNLGTYTVLTNWPANTSCKAIRTYGDYLIAINITDNGTERRRMFMWSNPALDGEEPDSWDSADPAQLAGFNITAREPIELIDGLELGGAFFLYSPAQVYRLQLNGSTSSVFDLTMAFDGGVISPNCVVEVGGQHFVFGREDVYTHDGITPRSIAHGRVQEFIFSTMNRELAHKAYVVHEEKLKEIHFCYVSRDELVGFEGATFCNRAAVYNYTNDTWSFIDLPNTIGGTYASPGVSQLWSTMTGSWAEMGGSWASMADSVRKALITVSRPLADQITVTRALVGDTVTGSKVALPISSETIKPAVLRRIGIDLGAPPSDVKMISRAMPKAHPRDIAGITSWRFGAYDFRVDDIVWSTARSFDPATEYKVDREASGRNLAVEVSQTDTDDFSLTGVDLEFRITSHQ